MAVEFTVDHKRTSEYRFAPEQIVVKPDLNGRHDVPDIQWLIKDILERGQLQPVIPPDDVMGPFNTRMGLFAHKNPKLVMDDGTVVWGCECWWGPEDQSFSER